MFFHDINDGDFIEVLRALPSSPAMTRAHILGAFGVLVSGDNPVDWWYALTRDRGEEGAAKAVAQLIISKGGKRVASLIKAEAAGRGLVPRADDPKLARLLFDESMEGFCVEQWVLREIVCEYYAETQVVLEDDDDDLPEPEDESHPEDPVADEEDGEHDVTGIADLFSGPSSRRGGRGT